MKLNINSRFLNNQKNSRKSNFYDYFFDIYFDYVQRRG